VGSRSFKAIGTRGKPVRTACYDTQQVSVYLAATIKVVLD